MVHGIAELVTWISNVMTLLPGDVIVTVNNSRVTNENEFSLILSASAAVQDTILNVIREGRLIRVILPSLPRQ
jgi:S1-C subfamily serine protease